MANKLIQLEDGTLVEVDVPEEEVQQISSRFADRVDATFEKIKPILINACKPIADAWGAIHEDLSIEKAEVTIGLSFEGEGNLYITKSKAGANLTVKLIIKPRESNEQ